MHDALKSSTWTHARCTKCDAFKYLQMFALLGGTCAITIVTPKESMGSYSVGTPGERPNSQQILKLRSLMFGGVPFYSREL